ncbi:MAG: amidophosphoribosyltransferase [Bacillota bacterium]|nr:amidophosphoribosyltransferase [Bacillota bacterium]
MRKLHEECGVFGICSQKPRALANSVYYGLFALQHRGQESCGIVVNDDGVLSSYRDTGLVGDAFTPEVLSRLPQGTMAMGHVRYGTAENASRVNAQPLVVKHIKGNMALCYNGSITNFHELRDELELKGSLFHTDCDVEVIAYLIIQERIQTGSIEEAVVRACARLEGAYSLLVMSSGKLIATRDKRGFHPLCLGETVDGDLVIASESCALDAAEAHLLRDVDPGEVLVFDKNGLRSLREHCGSVPRSLCVFEFVYFARPDSIIDGMPVHSARRRAGAFLARSYPVEADVVIGVPDSGIDAAIGYAQESGIPYGIGLLKNKYIGRTFIAPGQESRENKVRIKLNPISSTVKDKRVVLIDDSIVRGTTSARIVRLLREAGAKEVHMRVTAPPFVYPCYYGTDIPSRDVLIAYRMNHEEMVQHIGVDSLGFLRLEDVKCIADQCPDGFCTACFDGIYPTTTPAELGKARFTTKLSAKEENK